MSEEPILAEYSAIRAAILLRVTSDYKPMKDLFCDLAGFESQDGEG